MLLQLPSSQQFNFPLESTAPKKFFTDTRRPDGYDVIDIGASKGLGWGSINFLTNALKPLGAPHKKAILDPRTLGLDIDPKKVELCNKAQRGTYNKCAVGDILTLSATSLEGMSTRTISGNTYWHVLEHIPNCEYAEKMWVKAAALSKRFSNFHGPAFDHELSAQGTTPTGFHRFWENWTGHKCHFNSTMLERAIMRTAKTTAHVITNFGRIESTDHTIILPKGSVKDSHHYDPDVHPLKGEPTLLMKDNQTLYEEMRACAIYDHGIDNNEIHISLFSALCLNDALQGPKNMVGSQIVSCSLGKVRRIEDCVQMLRLKVKETLLLYHNTDNIIELI